MAEIKVGLCVLMTNAFIENWTGSELYVRDVAFELIKRGHKPIVYSPRIGKLADELGNKSIPVVTDLDSISVKPDLIHGQHHLETMTALSRFPGTPAIFFCHGWVPWEETPPFHPRITNYVTISDALHDRLVYEFGIPAEKIATIRNSVDLERFRPRPPLPDIPKRALVFNNRISEVNILGIVREACARHNIVINVIGYESNNASFNPEAQLGNYDIIFAVGRSAFESLAVGAAVICCSLEGVGQMVTTQNLEWQRNNNFGIRVLNQPLTVDILSAEIMRYDPLDAMSVSQRVRATSGQSDMVDQILDIYKISMCGFAEKYKQDLVAESIAFSSYLKEISVKVYHVVAEANLAHERIRYLQSKLDFIKGKAVRRLLKRIVRFSFVRDQYVKLITSIRHWCACL